MDDDFDWKTLGLVALLFYVASTATRALKTIKRTIERANNFGLTDDEMTSAYATLESKKATVAERQAAVATLQTKMKGAQAAGFEKQVRPAAKALETLERELAEQAKLADARAAWEKANPAEARKLKAVK